MKHLHFIGIEGSGASAVAAVAQAHGYQVSGCDRNLTGEYSAIFNPDSVFGEHSVDHLSGVDAVILSPAIEMADPDNPELKAAKKMNLEIFTWQQFLGKYLLPDKFVIAICGTHGKSTTTAMIAELMEDAQLDPTVVIGAKLTKWDRNYRIGHSKFFVIEADEYNNNFLAYQPDIAVVTNIDNDHLEYFKDLAHIEQSFEDFLAKTKQVIVANLVDSKVAETVKWVMKQSSVEVWDFNKIEADFDLSVPGEFNLTNAKAAFQTGLLLGVEPLKLIGSLNRFSGVGRRFEKIGLVSGAEVYSDFAHHPTEILATLKAAKQKFPDKKIKLIFQPHLYSRTKILFSDFVKVFQSARIDGAVIVDIFASRENDPGDISSLILVKAINMANIGYIPSVKQTLDGVKNKIRPNEVILLMGAGDIDKVGRSWLQANKSN